MPAIIALDQPTMSDPTESNNQANVNRPAEQEVHQLADELQVQATPAALAQVSQPGPSTSRDGGGGNARTQLRGFRLPKVSERNSEEWLSTAQELEAEILAELAELELVTPMVVMTRDTTFYTFDLRTGKLSEYLKPHIDRFKRNPRARASFLVLDDVFFTPSTMERLYTWIERYGRPSMRRQPVSATLSRWDKRFFSMELRTLYNFIMVAYKLKIHKLFVQCLQAIALMLAHKTFDEIITEFMLSNNVLAGEPSFGWWLTENGEVLEKMYTVHAAAFAEHIRRLRSGEPPLGLAVEEGEDDDEDIGEDDEEEEEDDDEVMMHVDNAAVVPQQNN